MSIIVCCFVVPLAAKVVVSVSSSLSVDPLRGQTDMLSMLNGVEMDHGNGVGTYAQPGETGERVDGLVGVGTHVDETSFESKTEAAKNALDSITMC